MMRYYSLLIALFFLVGPSLLPLDPMMTFPEKQYQPPDVDHIFGTDLLGRDVFARFVYGGQRTLLSASAATLLATAVGVPLGLCAGLVSGWSHRLLSGILSAVLSIPGLLLAMVVITLTGPSLASIVFAVGIAQIAPCAYTIRSAVWIVRQQLYVEAARSMGATDRHITYAHILRGIQPTLLAYTCVIFAYAILNNAALSFLGLAGEPGIPDWGAMLAEGRSAFRFAPWISLAPGIGITVSVWIINSLSDTIMKHG